MYIVQYQTTVCSVQFPITRFSLDGADSFGGLSRFASYSLYVYCTTFTNSLKVKPVLERNRSLQYGVRCKCMYKDLTTILKGKIISASPVILFPIHPSPNPSLSQPIPLPTHSSPNPSLYQSIHLPTHHSTNPSIFQPIPLPAHPSPNPSLFQIILLPTHPSSRSSFSQPIPFPAHPSPNPSLFQLILLPTHPSPNT